MPAASMLMLSFCKIPESGGDRVSWSKQWFSSPDIWTYRVNFDLRVSHPQPAREDVIMAILCIGSIFCIGSILNSGSILCIGSIFCIGSILCSGSILCIGSIFCIRSILCFPISVISMAFN